MGVAKAKIRRERERERERERKGMRTVAFEWSIGIDQELISGGSLCFHDWWLFGLSSTTMRIAIFSRRISTRSASWRDSVENDWMRCQQCWRKVTASRELQRFYETNSLSRAERPLPFELFHYDHPIWAAFDVSINIPNDIPVQRRNLASAFPRDFSNFIDSVR